ncbi:hypothetical protein FRB99_006059 [Tulasnella sp. 403]|nr:hypothetical protein FRB99_006059 [Tulasnella sp. 403]
MLLSLSLLIFSFTLIRALPTNPSQNATHHGTLEKRISWKWSEFDKNVCEFQNGKPTEIKISKTNGGLTKQYQSNIRFIGHNEETCIYDIPGGWHEHLVLGNVPAIAKTSRKDREPHLSMQETDALRNMGELLKLGFRKDRQWALIKWRGGTRLIEHPSYVRHFNGRFYNYNSPNVPEAQRRQKIDDCDQYMRSHYTALLDSYEGYIRDYGMEPELNWDDFVLYETEPLQYHYIDWSKGKQLYGLQSMEQREAYIKDKHVWWVSFLETRSAMPLRDVVNGPFQGICDSDRRNKKGERWLHPDKAAQNARAEMEKEQETTTKDDESRRQILAALDGHA